MWHKFREINRMPSLFMEEKIIEWKLLSWTKIYQNRTVHRRRRLYFFDCFWMRSWNFLAFWKYSFQARSRADTRGRVGRQCLEPGGGQQPGNCPASRQPPAWRRGRIRSLGGLPKYRWGKDRPSGRPPSHRRRGPVYYNTRWPPKQPGLLDQPTRRPQNRGPASRGLQNHAARCP